MAFVEEYAAKLSWKALAALAGAAALIAAGFAASEAYEHKVPWGLAHQRDRAAADRDANAKARDAAQALARAWQGSAQAGEAQRGVEHAQAVAAVSAAGAACDARVAAARRSALAIQTLVTKEPTHDPQGCAVRELVPAGELFDAIGARPAARG